MSEEDTFRKPYTPPPPPRLDRPHGLFTFDPALSNEVTGRPPPFTREHAGHWASFYSSPGEDVSEFPLEPEISEEEEELLMLRFANGTQLLSVSSLESHDDCLPAKRARTDESPVDNQQLQPQPDIVRYSQLQLQQLQHLFPSASCVHPALTCNLYRLPCCHWRESMARVNGEAGKNAHVQWLPSTPASLPPPSV